MLKDRLMGNTELKNRIGKDFINWADAYFADETRFNTKIPMEKVYDDCRHKLNFSINKRNFHHKLRLYCELKGYDFNPKELRDHSGQIRDIFYEKGEWVIKLCYYLGKSSVTQKNLIDVSKVMKKIKKLCAKYDIHCNAISFRAGDYDLLRGAIIYGVTIFATQVPNGILGTVGSSDLEDVFLRLESEIEKLKQC